MSDTDTQGDATQAMADADPSEVDAHRGLLDQALQVLQSQGVDTSTITGDISDVSQMSHGDLVSATMALAQQHPEVLQDVSQQFPEAQGLLGTVLQSGGIGGLLGKFL